MLKTNMGKRILSGFLAVLMLVAMIPIQAFAVTYQYNPNSNPTTITLTDNSGNRITGATITVTQQGSNDTYIVQEGTSGLYYFSRSSTNRWITYDIKVSKLGYNDASGSIRGSWNATTIQMTPITPEFTDFKVYYIADGQIPTKGYSGSNSAEYYGPSADNTPLVILRVNTALLRQIAAQENSPVKYGDSNLTTSNKWEFTPSGSHTDPNFKDNIKAFWDAVLSCTDEASIEAFKETGLFDNYMAYCLKKQKSGTLHADGILDVTPPVYVVELYQNEVYFGGGVSDESGDKPFLTAYDILDQYEAHLKQTITWVEDENGKPLRDENGHYFGTYVDTATNKFHHIEVFQTDDPSRLVWIEGSEIPYVKQADTYHLAKFNMSVDAGTPVKYLITYTDGVENEVIFNEHEYNAQRNETVPAFTGVTNREEYTFIGWVMDGDTSGKVYSDADIAAMTVTSDITFHAVWQPIPRYEGTVKVVINGTYDADTQTLLTGTLADIEVPLKLAEDTQVYLSVDELQYIPLSHIAEGEYTASLKNGIYHAYYKNGDEYIKISDQPLIIEGANRTRYLFYNTVYHDLNGGTLEGSSENILEYFHAGDRVVSGHHEDPVKEGYIFEGWQTNDGRLLKTGDVVTESIDRAYTVTAQWIKSADVYAHIKIDHYNEEGDTFNVDDAKHDIFFTIDTRKAGTDADYNEVYRNTIVWDGESDYADENYEYAYVTSGEQNYTRYIANTPSLTNVPAADEYTITANKSGYIFKNVYTETDENGDIHIYAELQFDPNEFDFTYSVVLDEEAKKLDKSLWPVAVNVKVTSYYEGTWYQITEHTHTYDRVPLDQNGEGTSFYPVWSAESGNGGKYYYRIDVVSYEMQGGSILPANNVNNTNYDAIDKTYLSVVEVTGGAAAEDGALDGAYYDGAAQKGDVKAIVSIPVYDVTFISNGGSLNGSYADTVLKDQIVMPIVENYVPERSGGYIFEGWYVYKDGVMTSEAPVSGKGLTEDVQLIAKWRDPVSVEGIVTFAGTYDQINEDGSVTTQYFNDFDRVSSARVLLQKKTPAGYYETVDWRELSLDYTFTDYWFQKTETLKVPVGIAFYSFTGLPDDGSEYRVYVLTANFSETFQNEPESVLNAKKYDTYTKTDYDALFGEVRPEVATVNVHLHFEPRTFDLAFKVDATAIGAALRPTNAELAITCDVDPSKIEPQDWPVITQMIFDGEVRGYNALLSDGIAQTSIPVWINTTDGATLYDYGLNLLSTTTDGKETDYVENPYYTVEYEGPAHYDNATGEQNKLLVAKLMPKIYNINYITNGGTILGTYTNKHIWSFETKLSEVVPVREGYRFDGWYTDEALTQPLTDNVIAADVANDVTYYAKWQQIMDRVNLEITVNHATGDDGLNGDFNTAFTAVLSRKLRDSADDFIQIPTQTKEIEFNGVIDEDYEQTSVYTDVFTDLSSRYDYNLFVNLDGYYVDPEKSSVEKVTAEDGSTQHNVKIYLQFNPDLLHLDFTVKMADQMEIGLYPSFAEVKITCWDKNEWKIITQHQNKVVDVEIDPMTGIGEGSYPVWQWDSDSIDGTLPYYYRVEVVSLELKDGSVIHLNETTQEIEYAADGYTATVYMGDGAEIPEGADLGGAYGIPVNLDNEEDTIVNNYVQSCDIDVVINAPAVIFHANNEDADCYDSLYDIDVFRTYYPSSGVLPQGEYYNLTEDGKITAFYDIPTFEYNTHNNYIFKGWYTAPDETGEPIDWDDVYTETTHIYAHWIEVADVAKDEADGKQTGSDKYAGYDLVGAQIRDKALDEIHHHGNAGSGLRFITVFSESVYEQINAISGNEAEYGFAVAKKEHADKRAIAYNDPNYKIEYKGANVNGVDTSKTYSYVKNMMCSGVVDHYNGENYRLYTAVVTYNNLEGDALESAYATEFVARSYIRYYDANGLYRTYYNNYTGTQLYNSCSTSFANVRDIVSGGGAQ